MRRVLLSTLLCGLAFLAAPQPASAAGPVLQGGLVRTQLADQGDLRFSGLDGGAYKVGFEVGSHRWRNEWAFNQTVLSGADPAGYGHQLTLTGMSYQLSFMFWEKGFTPYLGAGVEMGLASLKESGASRLAYDSVWFDTSEGGYIRPYGILGLRIQFGFGLGLRGEVTASYYGDFVAVSTNLGLSYTW